MIDSVNEIREGYISLDQVQKRKTAKRGEHIKRESPEVTRIAAVVCDDRLPSGIRDGASCNHAK